MSALEDELALHLHAAGLPAPERQYRFYPARRWKADFAYPAHKLLIEVEGGVWSGGRHTTGAGFSADCEKYNAAVMAGFRVLRFTGKMVQDGTALKCVEEILRPHEVATVDEFLTINAFLRPLLTEATKKIMEHFPEANINLELLHDPEGCEGCNNVELGVWIMLNADPHDAFLRFKTFKYDWWLDNLDQAQEKMCILIGLT